MALENSRYMEQFLSKKAHTPGKMGFDTLPKT